MDPRFPDIKVTLVGEDGNAFAILGRVRKALQRANVQRHLVDEYHREATMGDYDHLLATTLAWVTVE